MKQNMSVIAEKRWKAETAAAPPASAKRASIVAGVAAIGRFIRTAIVSTGKHIWRALDVMTEARLQRALIEAELYRNRYKHSSKNDDDLPVVQ